MSFINLAHRLYLIQLSSRCDVLLLTVWAYGSLRQVHLYRLLTEAAHSNPLSKVHGITLRQVSIIFYSLIGMLVNIVT